MEENMQKFEGKPRTKRNIMGIISLVLSAVGLVGSWIPVLNLISILLAVAGVVLGIISIVMVCLKKAGLIVLPILGVVFGVLAITLGIIVNTTVFKEAKKSLTTGTQTSSVVSTQNNSTTAKKVYKVGDKISWDGKEITITDVDRNFKAKYSKPKSGKEFVKVTINLSNESNKDISASPFSFKMQDSTGSKGTLESCTYSLSDTFDLATLVPGGSKKGSIVFEVNKDDTDLRLVCTASSALPSEELEIKL